MDQVGFLLKAKQRGWLTSDNLMSPPAPAYVYNHQSQCTDLQRCLPLHRKAETIGSMQGSKEVDCTQKLSSFHSNLESLL